MSTIAFFMRKHITENCCEHDSAEIETALHEIGFSFERHDSERETWWSVSDGSYYTDEDGAQCPVTFNITLLKHTEYRLKTVQGECYAENIYFDCFGGYGYDQNGERAPDACALLLKFLHRYFAYYPDAYFRAEDYYSKAYIDEKYDSGAWEDWF